MLRDPLMILTMKYWSAGHDTCCPVFPGPLVVPVSWFVTAR